MKEIIPILHQIFKNTEKQGTLPNSFSIASIIKIPKPDKRYIKGKLKTSISHKHRRKNPQKMQATQTIHKIIDYNQVGFILGMQG